jgi:hypothetical protein
MGTYADATVRARDLAGAREIGSVLGVAPNTVNAWLQRENVGFPRPVARLGCGNVWDIQEVLAWAARTGRTVQLPGYSAPGST